MSDPLLNKPDNFAKDEGAITGGSKCCFFFVGIIMILYAVIALIVALIMFKKTHWQIIVTGIGVVTAVPSLLFMGFLVLRGKISKTYGYLLILMLVPIIFSGVAVFTSIKIVPADDFKSCPEGQIWQNIAKKCVSCNIGQCLNFRSFTSGSGSVCERTDQFGYIDCKTSPVDMNNLPDPVCYPPSNKEDLRCCFYNNCTNLSINCTIEGRTLLCNWGMPDRRPYEPPPPPNSSMLLSPIERENFAAEKDNDVAENIDNDVAERKKFDDDDIAKRKKVDVTERKKVNDPVKRKKKVDDGANLNRM